MKDPLSGTIWVTWEKQIRNRSMSSSLGVSLYEVISNKKKLSRYMHCTWKTLTLIIKLRPRVVVCQNPSIVLTQLLLMIKRIFRFSVVIDAHFGGIEASYKKKNFQRALDWCNRSAALVIVTNETHARQVSALGGKAFVCPDPLPQIEIYKADTITISKKLFLICSYDPDEPFLEVFKAAQIIKSEGFELFVSGRYQKAGISAEDYPEINLLGYISDRDFYKHLFSSEVVIDLTENDDCLVCGAYEALVANKPLILSRKKVLQQYFSAGTVFTENTAPEIVEAIKIAYAKRNKLSEESRDWVVQANASMEKRMVHLRNILAGI